MNKLEYIPGDLVMVDGFNTPYKITDVESQLHSDDFLYTLDPIGIGPILFNLPIDSFCPITLTIEILEKNGWKFLKHHKRNSYGDVYWRGYHKPAETNISLIFYPEEEAFFIFLYAQEISETPIRYIHQLQHLLFGLGRNSEMEI